MVSVEGLMLAASSVELLLPVEVELLPSANVVDATPLIMSVDVMP